MRGKLFQASLALLLLAGCKEKQEVPRGEYELDLREAFDRLTASDFSEFRSNRQCGILIQIKPALRTDRAILWQVTSSNLAQLSFTATLTPVGERRTRVDVTVSPERGALGEAYDGTRFYRRPAVRQPVKPAIEEQIAAVLQGRPFDYRRLPPAKPDTVCLVQRGGLESGKRFSVDGRDEANAR